MATTGQYAAGTVVSLNDESGGDWAKPDFAQVDDSNYTTVASGSTGAQNIGFLRLHFSTGPDTNEIILPSWTEPNTEREDDIIIFGPGALLSWSGDNPTPTQIRNSSFGFEVQYFLGNPQVFVDTLRATNFGFDGGGNPLPLNTVIDKIILHLKHWQDDANNLFKVNFLSMTVDYSLAAPKQAPTIITKLL